MNCWTEGVSIEIRPKPPLEEEEATVQSSHKTPRPKRQLKAGNKAVPEQDIEDEYKAFPIRFVREAQKGIEDGSFDEAWAVFDKDIHPRHAEAFQLAATQVNGKCVRIAFSSISFEHWVLLHFEKNKTAFVKSECKDGKKVLQCGTGHHVDDCQGARCVVGHIKVGGYLPDYSKQANMDLYTALKDSTNLAIENASWLRSQVVGSPIYGLNPYTDIDILVKRLLQLEVDYVWLTANTTWENDGIKVAFGDYLDGHLAMTVSNNKRISHVFNKTASVSRDDERLGEVTLDFGLIASGETKEKYIEILKAYADLPNLNIRIDLEDGHILMVDLAGR